MIPPLPNYFRHEVEKHGEEEEKHEVWDQHVALFELITFANGLSGSLVFPANRFEDRIDSFRQTFVIVIAPKMRFDSILSDVETRYVRQRAFQPITGVYAHLAILEKYK